MAAMDRTDRVGLIGHFILEGEVVPDRRTTFDI